MKSTKSEIAESRQRKKDGTFVMVFDDKEKLFPIILERLENGEGLNSICSQEGMPSHSTVHRWMNEKSDMKEEYYAARKIQAHYLADRVGDIADGVLAGKYKPDACRVAIQGFQWKAKVMNPNRFGDEKRHTIEAGESWRQIMTAGRQRREAAQRAGIIKEGRKDTAPIAEHSE